MMILVVETEGTTPGGGSGGAPDLASAVHAFADRTSAPALILDRSGRIRHVNPAAGALLGLDPSSAVGVDVLSLVHPAERARAGEDLTAVITGQSLGGSGEYRVRGAGGSWRTIATIASNLSDLSSSGGVLISGTDVTAQKDHERSLRDLALRDPVTGLPNRFALREHLESRMALDGPLAVAFVDLDHFKRVNECLGHTVGDAVLQAVGARLNSLIPRSCTVAHFGADTFVIVLCDIGDERSISLAWELIARLANPLFISGHELRLGASVGVAVRDQASTPESILRDADAALTRAKLNRRGGVEVFSEALRTEAVWRLALETDLRHAVERDELRLHLQAVVRLSTGRTECAEALLRWAPAGREAIAPTTFIPLAEGDGGHRLAR